MGFMGRTELSCHKMTSNTKQKKIENIHHLVNSLIFPFVLWLLDTSFRFICFECSILINLNMTRSLIILASGNLKKILPAWHPRLDLSNPTPKRVSTRFFQFSWLCMYAGAHKFFICRVCIIFQPFLCPMALRIQPRPPPSSRMVWMTQQTF